MEKKLSIIIPSYNESRLIGLLLSRLCGSKHINDIEIIIVDGGSSDNTVHICKQYNVSIIHADKSRAIQMNMGARAAQSPYLYFVHADVIPPITFYEDIFLAIAEGHEFGFFRQKFDSNNPLLWINAFFTRFNQIWNRGGDQSMFISKKIFSSINGFDEKFIIMEEYDLMLRLQDIVPRYVIPKYTLVSSRKYHNNSWLKVQYANYIAMRMFYNRIDPYIISEAYHKLLNKYN